MLVELNIRDFAIIDELRVGFRPGLNVLTGETGAGKSIIIDALGAVLGERVGVDVVRTGANGASVEAIFDLRDHLSHPRLDAFLADSGLELEEGTLILARDVAATGRSTARINGRATTAGMLSRAGALLVDIHGQSDHLSLLRPSEQIDVLDRFAGVLEERAAFSRLVEELREVNGTLHEIVHGERERQRQADLLTFQVNEINEANLEPGEEDRLNAERQVLANAERLVEGATAGYALLSGSDEPGAGERSIVETLRLVAVQIGSIAEVDLALRPVAERINEVLFLLEDSASDLRDYRDRIEANPILLDRVDERLDQLRRLKKKYGQSIDEVIAYGASAAEELSRLTDAEANVDTLEERRRLLLDEIGRMGRRLSELRLEAAERFELGVESSIAELNMGRSTFRVSIGQREVDHGAPVPSERGLRHLDFDATGMDRVEFLLGANAGETPKPLARVASGGETARLMLALKSILADADETPTLVFDEVDVGVGGRSGQVVGEKLWELTSGHQVIVITHLPQIAAFAESHLRITKTEREGRTVSNIVEIDGAERLEELAMMIDGKPVSEASLRSAKEITERIDGWKKSKSKLVNV